MDGGLAVLGFGLFLFSIANLYARSAYGLAWVVLALSLVSMGMAFSESKNLRTYSLGLGAALLLASGVALIAGVAWWMALGAFLFGVAYMFLWAEFRFSAFGNVRAEDVPVRTPGRWRIHLPSRRQRV
jgi:membrane associated rhomboid family serine protease